MKKRIRSVGRLLLSRLPLLLVVLALALAVSPLPAAAAELRPETAPLPYVPGEVLIGWQPDSGEVPQGAPPKGFRPDQASAAVQSAVQILEARTGLTVLEAEPYHGTARLSVPLGQVQAEIARLSALPWIEYAEPNYIATAAETYPDDPDIGRQWNMRRIYAPAAWDVTMGGSSIKVAVVDTGIDRNHPEFSGRILKGYDYVNYDDQPDDDHYIVDIYGKAHHSHGTHVSGILAAASDNGIGVAGLASNVMIMPLKVLDSTGGGTHASIASAIMYAADNGAQIINLSLQSLNTSDTLYNAVKYAANTKGRLLVVAAGNYGASGNPAVYPAAYPEVFTIAASDHDDNWASYSGYNSHVDLAAPGGVSSDEIWSTVRQSYGDNGGDYGYDNGTSMATPLASAAAALVWTYLPAASRLDITDILKQTADKVGVFPYVGGRNDYFGYGRLNVGKAVRWAYPPSLSPNPSGTRRFLLGESAGQAGGEVALINPSDQPLEWIAEENAAWLSLGPSSGSGMASFSAPGKISFQVGPTALPPGQYQGVIRVTYNAGASSFDIPVQLQIAATLHDASLPLVANKSLGMRWYDPLPDGQALDLSDNSVTSVSLPFQVSFYGQNRSSMWVSDNGAALFTVPAAAATFNPTNCMPSATRPNDAFYVLWHDWDPDLGGQVYVHQPDNDTFVITWLQVRRSGNPTPHSFQLVLTRDKRVVFQYDSVASPLEGTIGVENFDGTLAQQILCNGAGRQVRSGDALLMQPVVPW